MESFSLNFAKIKLEYFIQNDDGTLGESTEATFDIRANEVS
jgi:type VI protein secretion system component Hcp